MRRMAKYHLDHGITVDREATAKQLQITANLCARLNDDYNVPYDRNDKKSIARMVNKEDALRKQDLKMLGTMIEKYLCHWWD